MKLKLLFKFLEFNYNYPIIIQKKNLSQNQLLNVTITHNGIEIEQINFSTLPSFHQHGLMEWKFFLSSFFEIHELNLDNVKLDLPFFNMVKINQNQVFTDEFYYVIESILFAIIRKLAPIHLKSIPRNPIKVNSLYSADVVLDILPKCLKIKIRPTLKNLNDTIALINRLLDSSPTILFRLDGNRCFEIDELLNFLKNLENQVGLKLGPSIDYIEEPFKNANDNKIFTTFLPYAIAIDESLSVYKNKLNLLPNNTNIVLKPSLIGLSKSFEILNLAQTYQHNIIISSTYETSSAMMPLFFLAALNPSAYHGLDTLKALPKHLRILEDDFSLLF